jgi:hypothetical protein
MIALDGGFDLRTPVANAVQVVKQFPHGKLLVVRGVGHSVTPPTSPAARRTTCASGSSARSTRRTGRVRERVKPIAKVVRVFPRGPPRRPPRDAAAVGQTLREAEATLWFGLSKPARGSSAASSSTARTASLHADALQRRAGRARQRQGHLRRPRPASTFTGTVKVSGSAAVAGTLKIAKNGTITGTSAAEGLRPLLAPSIRGRA